ASGGVGARHGRDAVCKLLGPWREVRGDEVEDLAAVIAARVPPRRRAVGSLDGGPDVLAIPLTHFAERVPARRDDTAGVGGVGAGPHPRDEQLVRPINRGKGDGGRGTGGGRAARRDGLLRPLPRPRPPAPARS